MKILTLLLLISFISGCDKNRNNQYSVWYVNGKEFQTNDVSIESGKAIIILKTNNHSNGFRLTFEKATFTNSGKVYLKCNTPNPMFGCFSIYYSDKVYKPKDSTFFTASFPNERASYQLDESWFYNAYNSEDSILVSGVFNQP